MASDDPAKDLIPVLDLLSPQETEAEAMTAAVTPDAGDDVPIQQHPAPVTDGHSTFPITEFKKLIIKDKAGFEVGFTPPVLHKVFAENSLFKKMYWNSKREMWEYDKINDDMHEVVG